MQQRINRLTLVLAILTALAFVTAANGADIFVGVNGNDAWSGELTEPNVDESDGPFATLERAKMEARVVKTIEPVTVFVRGGTYFLQQPFTLEPADSGTAERPVLFSAYPGEKPVFSGGRRIIGWRQGPGELWQVDLSEVRQGDWYFRQLFVDGERRQRARSPNKGYHRIAELIPGPEDPRSKPIARDKFIFSPGDLHPWSELGDVNLTLMHSWETSIHPIGAVDTALNTVTFAAPMTEWWSIGYWEEEQRYYVENAFELLDEPGEWYLSRASGVLSYWPLEGEQPDQVEVIAPAVPTKNLIRVNSRTPGRA